MYQLLAGSCKIKCFCFLNLFVYTRSLNFSYLKFSNFFFDRWFWDVFDDLPKGSPCDVFGEGGNSFLGIWFSRKKESSELFETLICYLGISWGGVDFGNWRRRDFFGGICFWRVLLINLDTSVFLDIYYSQDFCNWEIFWF